MSESRTPLPQFGIDEARKIAIGGNTMVLHLIADLDSEIARLREELAKAKEEISDLQFTVQKEWEARNRFQVELKTAKGLCHDASSELSRLREELARARMARDCVNCKNNGMDCSKRNYSCAGFEIKEAAK